MNECPTCGRDDFGSERAMKIHHSLKHGVSLVNEDTTTEHEVESVSLNDTDGFTEFLKDIERRIRSIEEKFDLDTGLDDVSDPLIS